MRAIVLERNKMVSRRIARVWTCAGLECTTFDEPEQAMTQLAGASLLGADLFDAELVVAALRAQPALRAVLWTAEPMERPLRHSIAEPRLSSILGRASFDSTPRDWELLMVARRLARSPEARVPFAAFLAWGASGLQLRVADTAGSDAAVARVQAFVNGIGAPKRVGGMFGELAHELLRNALYDAPVDASGRPRHAHDRKAAVSVGEAEAATLRLASDGARLVLQVVDPFGRLERRHVFEGLARGLAGGVMDQSGGGAGLGMLVCHNSTVAMVYDVVRGQMTEATGFFDLDLNLREFRTQARSLHFFEAPK